MSEFVSPRAGVGSVVVLVSAIAAGEALAETGVGF
jgi:hypothetical protein